MCLFLQHMIYHFITGTQACTQLQEAIEKEPEMQGTIVCMEDALSIGPLQPSEGESFRTLRENYYKELSPNEKNPVQCPELDKVDEIIQRLQEDNAAIVWFWVAPAAVDICAYYWLLTKLACFTGRLYVVNIAGLPFLDENGKLFYPKSFKEIPAKEMIKARKLARAITPAEREVDVEEWRKILAENTDIRLYEGGKKIQGKNADHFDSLLLSFCSGQMQKASKILRQTISRYQPPVPDLFLLHRLRYLVQSGKLIAQGNIEKPANEWDIKTVETQPESTENTEASQAS
jgi:hypothetical protein